MKPSLLLIIFLFTNKTAICQSFEINCNKLDFDSTLVLDFVLKGKEIDASKRGSFQIYGSYYVINDTTYYRNRKLKIQPEPIIINFFNGEEPYAIEWGPYKEFGIEGNKNSIYSEIPGIFNAIATDTKGRTDNCFLNYYMPSNIDLTVCNQDEINLSHYLNCFYVEDLLIAYEIKNQVDTVSSIDKMPALSNQLKKIKLRFLDRISLRNVHLLDLKITNLQIGDHCDDKDECTINDIIREDLSCEGTHIIDSLYIDVEYLTPCNPSKKVKVSTEKTYFKQSWHSKYDRTKFGNSAEFYIKKPSSITLEVKDQNGCKLRKSTEITPFEKITIQSNQDTICNGETVVLNISENETFDKIVWIDEFGNVLDTINNKIIIDYPSKYSVHLQKDGCIKIGAKEVSSNTPHEYKINLEDNNINDKTELLSISPKPNWTHEKYTWKRCTNFNKSQIKMNYDWELLTNYKDSLIVTKPGIYSLEVEQYKNNLRKSCKSYNEVILYDNNTPELIEQQSRYLRTLSNLKIYLNSNH